MTKLEKLYSIIENSRDVGVKLPEDVIRQVEELEENIIKDEILPSLSSDLSPRLEPIKRDLVLVVEYHPGEPISVGLSRKAKISEIIDVKRLEIDPQVEHKEYGELSKQVEKCAPKTGLCIIRRDGSILQEKNAALTFAKAVHEAGLLRVRELGLKFCKVPLVSTTRDKKYGNRQIEMEPGIFVITHSNNKEKKDRLDRINQTLHLGWTVKIID